MRLSRALEATNFTARRRFDEDAATLIGSSCGECGTRSWPGRAVCSHCGSDDITEHVLPRVGTLNAYTTVWVPRTGLSSPYVLGQVDFGMGAIVFGHLRGLEPDVVTPSPVGVVFSDDVAAVPRFWFEPA